MSSKSTTNSDSVTKVKSKLSAPSQVSQDSQGSQKSQGSQGSQKSVGMGPSLRMTSTDIRELTRETIAVSQTNLLTAEGGSPPGETVYDAIAYIIYCQEHDKMAISRANEDKITWLPFIACPSNKTWKDASVDGVSIIFNKQDAELDAKLGTKIPIKEMHCLHIFRTQIPGKHRFISLVIQCVYLGKNTSSFKCCQNSKRIHWLPLKDVMKGNIEKVWGPEVQDFSKSCKKIKPTGLTEHSLEKAFFYVPKDKPQNVEEALIKGAGVGEPEVERLYEDYIEHCFPSLSMSFDSFKDYMTRYLESYDKNDSRFPLLFNAFNYEKNNCLNFHEFLLGMVSMEPSAPHAEARIKFIFRYYDLDSDAKLTDKEFRKLVKDISIGSPDSTIDAKVKEAFDTMGAKDNSIDLEAFCKAIGNKSFRGTSNLCRAPKSILAQITKFQTTRTEKKTAVKKKAGFLMQNRRNRGICFACRGKKYDYGLHSIKLDTNGRCVEPRRIFEPESLDEKMTSQKYSMEFTFNTRSIAHSFVDMIRDFSRKKGSLSDQKGFMSNDKETLVNYLNDLTKDLESFLSSEERVIKLNSPTYVFGDIFGNLDDLLAFETLLWHSFPVISSHYVFLGNYVDKGKWGIECAIYLFALKMIAPMKFILLRGNHECKDMQMKNTFQKECISKYGNKFGPKIWELINNVFDKLPLGAIIDESIFCSHSGVPNSAAKIDDICSLSVDLKDPEKCPIAWELMNSEVKENEVKKFLKSFGFSHMIRSNALSSSGYGIAFGGKCLTVFSSSRFENNKNEAVVVFVDTDRIRIIRLDTTKTQKGTDPK